MCRPHIFEKPDTGTGEYEWVKLAKCNLIVRSTKAGYTFHLYLEHTNRCILSSLICPGTEMKPEGQKRWTFILYDVNNGPKRYLIQVGSPEIAEKLGDVVSDGIFLSVLFTKKQLPNLHQTEPVFERLPSPNTEQYNKRIELLTNSKCIFGTQAALPLGPVSMYLHVYGPSSEPLVTRLVIRSLKNPAITFLNIDLDDATYSAVADQNYGLKLRIFGDGFEADFIMSTGDADQYHIIETMRIEAALCEDRFQYAMAAHLKSKEEEEVIKLTYM